MVHLNEHRFRLQHFGLKFHYWKWRTSWSSICNIPARLNNAVVWYRSVYHFRFWVFSFINHADSSESWQSSRYWRVNSVSIDECFINEEFLMINLLKGSLAECSAPPIVVVFKLRSARKFFSTSVLEPSRFHSKHLFNNRKRDWVWIHRNLQLLRWNFPQNHFHLKTSSPRHLSRKFFDMNSRPHSLLPKYVRWW